jgi:tetratricopeptide (TPR) repeat protein
VPQHLEGKQESKSTNYGLGKYSSTLIQRGLELANTLIQDHGIQDQIKLIDVSDREIAQNFVQEGILYQNLGSYEEAINSYTQAIIFSPEYIEAYILRCLSYIGGMKFLNALEDYEAACQINNEATEKFISSSQKIEEGVQEMLDLMVYAGNVCYSQGKHQRAIEIHTDILRFSPHHSGAYSSRSSARSAVKDYQGAIEDLQNSRRPILYKNQSLYFSDWLKFLDFAFKIIDDVFEFLPEMSEKFKKSFQESFQKSF